MDTTDTVELPGVDESGATIGRSLFNTISFGPVATTTTTMTVRPTDGPAQVHPPRVDREIPEPDHDGHDLQRPVRALGGEHREGGVIGRPPVQLAGHPGTRSLAGRGPGIPGSTVTVPPITVNNNWRAITIETGRSNLDWFGPLNFRYKPKSKPKPIANPKMVTRRVLNMAEEGWVVK